jgi:threonine dehydratase
MTTQNRNHTTPFLLSSTVAGIMCRSELGLRNILEAKKRLEGVVQETPLVLSKFHPEVYYKAENLQLTGSFKLRAAFNQLSLLPNDEKQQGVVTSSSGNFAQAVAYASKIMGISCKIVMMRSANALKVARTRQLGGKVVFCEDRFSARQEAVSAIQQKEQRAAIHPYDHLQTIAGNGTLALEILKQLPKVKNIVVPISGGGLIGGIALAAKAHSPQIKIWGIQPQGANATQLSWQAGKRVSIRSAQTIADGLTATLPGKLTFPIIQQLVESIEVVKEDSIRQAVAHCLLEEKLAVEPSGAVPLAAAFEGKIPLCQTVLVLSGGNITPALMQQILSSRQER